MKRQEAERNIGAWSQVTLRLLASTVGSLDVNTQANPLASESKFQQSLRSRIWSRNVAGTAESFNAESGIGVCETGTLHF